MQERHCKGSTFELQLLGSERFLISMLSRSIFSIDANEFETLYVNIAYCS